MKRIFSTLVVLAFFIGCDNNDEPDPSGALYFPPISANDWETISPGSLGWDESKIAELDAFLVATNTRALLVLKEGKIVIEKYSGKQLVNTSSDFDADSNWYWASAGKTLTSALVGIAEAEGKINFDTKTSDYLGTGWTSLTAQQENKITVWHQLTMTTGLDDGV